MLYHLVGLITATQILVPTIYVLTSSQHITRKYIYYGFVTWLGSVVMTTFGMLFGDGILTSTFYWRYELIKMMCLYVYFEFWFYWIHRLFHTPMLYRFHKMHHEAIHPHPLDGLVNHPLESGVLNLCAVIGIQYLQIHVYTYYMLIVGVHVGLYLNHSYIDPHHQLHHTKFNRNFGMTSIGDYFGGTLA